MKKLIKATACIAAISAMLINYTAFADETDIPEPDEPAAVSETAEPAENGDVIPDDTDNDILAVPDMPYAVPTASTLDFTVQIADKKYVVASFIKVEVYDKTGALVGTDREWIGGITESVDLHYDVPEYALGDSFTVKLVEGADTLKYYDTTIRPGQSFEIETSYYYSDDGALVPYNSYVFEAVPLWEKEVVVYVNDRIPKLPSRARIVNGSTLVPVRAVAEAMGISVYYDKDYDSVVCSVGNDQIIYNLNSTYATFFGEDLFLPVAPQYFEGNTYVPVRSLAEAFEAPIESLDFGDHLDVVIGESEVVNRYEPVNSWDISSRTDYMVWVSKSEYTVRVYEGSMNNWHKIYTAPCAIGAPGTPTITGSYEYIERTFWEIGRAHV